MRPSDRRWQQVDVPSVLVVDDDTDIRLLFRVLLRGTGWSVAVAGSGPEALERLAQDDQPDVVVLDVQMPEVSGWDTLAAIRRDPGTAHLPVVLCTVKGAAIDEAHGWDIGCDGYVAKPFNPSEVVDELDRVLLRPVRDRLPYRRAALGRALARQQLER